jgi:hypothetical protein
MSMIAGAASAGTPRGVRSRCARRVAAGAAAAAIMRRSQDTKPASKRKPQKVPVSAAT